MMPKINLLPFQISQDGLAKTLEREKVLFVNMQRSDGEKGVLVMTWTPTDGRPLSDEAMAMAKKNFMTASENLSLFHRMRMLAAYDELTGLYNRRVGKMRLSEEISRSERRGSPLCAAMLDLDHFKAVNDTYGHQAGDRVLRHVCRIFRECLRAEDILIRYGGEEILAVMPGTELEDACDILERLRASVADEPLNHKGRCIPVTVSAGAARLHEAGDGPNDAGSLVALADRRLYMAKQKGRNQVVCFDLE
ncbi:diguanylate cyclase [Desulfatibacillum aliphaticivorans]|uniref:diguanylate cyclase n=1 Tax=Desulfatibacillum aliphaticivorans TaxID=218208 RepID=B8FIF9_DESAL|nr:GGDEF domain-containing protein [Desulfatibacillum aliphaticivorans]ACL03949.1 diguanylate cyclase [Desulfatibacillum aliphaticivorans]